MARESPPLTDPRVGEIVARLVTALAPERIYMFGSRARGDAHADSDYDLLVVVTTSAEPRYKRAQGAYRALGGVGVPIDVIVLTREEFERQAVVVTSLPATIEREGLLVYAA